VCSSYFQLALAAVQYARDTLLTEQPTSLPFVVEIAHESRAGGAAADPLTAITLSDKFVRCVGVGVGVGVDVGVGVGVGVSEGVGVGVGVSVSVSVSEGVGVGVWIRVCECQCGWGRGWGCQLIMLQLSLL